MSDIVSNRRHLNIAQKLRIMRLTLRENGILWSGCLGCYYLSSSASDFFFQKMQRLRKDHGAPGLNSPALNREIWKNWDWSAGGEEWTPSEEWKTSLVDCILKKHVSAGKDLLEIGPGAGRWTEYLVQGAKSLVGIDISESCVEVCTEKFGSQEGVRFAVTEGWNLPGVADESIDTIWSFDVFVHINLEEAGKYLAEFNRVLRPGGRAVIHHGAVGGVNGGWRSNVTGESFKEAAESSGLKVVDQIAQWTDGGGTHKVGLYDDLVSVVEKR